MYAKYIVSRCPDLCLVCIKGFHRPSTLDWEALSSRSGSSSDAKAVRCERGRYGHLRTGAEAERLDVYLSGGGILLMQ